VELSWVQVLLSQQFEPQLPSQVSPGSTKLLEQTAAQSLSLRPLQDDGQQPSPEVQALISVSMHWAEQVAEDPTNSEKVQALGELHCDGQSSSHTSPTSRIELPQTDWQSLSVSESQPGAQQPSPFVHAKIRELEQSKSQVVALPVAVSTVQALLSSQLVAQLPSQTSPASTKLF
jgi:hypothetical protein